MSTTQTVILIVEPELILATASDDSKQQMLIRRLREYVDLKLIKVVLVSLEEPSQLATKLTRHGFDCQHIIFDPATTTAKGQQRHRRQPEENKPTDQAEAFNQWLVGNFADSSKVIMCVSSPTTRTLAGTICSVAVPSLGEPETFKLYRQHQEFGSLNQLFLSTEDQLRGVFAGLHWFDALPQGASENSRSNNSRSGAHSIKRDCARVAVKTWASSVELVVNRNGWKRTAKMSRMGDRTFVADIEHFQPGDRYAFALDGNHDKLYPDPHSRSQPEGVHGFSELTGPNKFPWRDRDWKGVPKRDLIVYELHIGTFTSDGTFLSTIERLPELVELGITAIELLPVVESAGRWNWGYDGVNLFAPYHQYGTPDDLKLLVDRCHQLGLAVILDVVYNHPGPEGNYLAAFGPYFSDKHHTPWGPAYNYDGRDRDLCRDWVVDNVEYWLDEFHFDGLRFDAIHFMFDENETSIVEEISHRVRKLGVQNDKQFLLIGESNIFDAALIKPINDGGFGFDAIWCDDMMHSIYSVGSPETRLTDRTYHQHSDVAESLKHGFLYQGPPTERINRTVKTPVDTNPIASMVVALQTHDSVGNQPLGKRLHQLTNADFHRAAATLSLLYPAIPMLFMGDESLEPNPFHYFVDFHDPWLRDAISKSRRNEHPQQDWDETISPLSEAAFIQSKVTPLSSCDSVTQRQITREWYRRLISIRKDLISQELLHANQLTVTNTPERQLFQLVYQSENAIVSLAVRLNNPAESEPEPIAIQIEGQTLADSLAADKSEYGEPTQLSGNHAIVVKGRIKILE